MPVQPGIFRANVPIPDEYSSQIIQQTIQESAALSLCRRVNMGAGATHLPVMATLPSAGFVNPRDIGRKPLASAGWEGVILTAEEIACIVPVPEALIADATWDIFGEIKPRIAEAMGAAVDAAAFFGVGAPATWPVGGVVGHAVAAGNTHATSPTPVPVGSNMDLAEDINETMQLVELDGFDVDGFAAAVGFKGRLRGLRDRNNQLLFLPSLQAGTPAELYAEPIQYSRNGAWVPASAALVAGDWDNACLGIRQDITMKILTEATFTDGAGLVTVSLAETDQVAIRVYMRLGFAIANPATLINPVKATRSPFGVLLP